jgi:hypothetical protein
MTINNPVEFLPQQLPVIVRRLMSSLDPDHRAGNWKKNAKKHATAASAHPRTTAT